MDNHKRYEYAELQTASVWMRDAIIVGWRWIVGVVVESSHIL